MSQITIDSLHLDLRGVPPESARAAAASLGPAIQQAIAAQLLGRHPSGLARLERVTAPAVRLTSTTPGAVSSTIATAVASAVAHQLPSGR